MTMALAGLSIAESAVLSAAGRILVFLFLGRLGGCGWQVMKWNCCPLDSGRLRPVASPSSIASGRDMLKIYYVPEININKQEINMKSRFQIQEMI